MGWFTKVPVYLDALRTIANDLLQKGLPGFKIVDHELQVIIADLEAGEDVTKIISDLANSWGQS